MSSPKRRPCAPCGTAAPAPTLASPLLFTVASWGDVHDHAMGAAGGRQRPTARARGCVAPARAPTRPPNPRPEVEGPLRPFCPEVSTCPGGRACRAPLLVHREVLGLDVVEEVAELLDLLLLGDVHDLDA